MSEGARAYPLSWPVGWTRAKFRQHAKFSSARTSVTIARALVRLQSEVDRLKATDVVLSSNLRLLVNGSPRSDQREPEDPGVALYFVFKKRPTVLACDKWHRTADNIAAIAKHIEALRGQERWGVGNLEQAFRGYTALPPAMEMGAPWRDVLNLPRQMMGETRAVQLEQAELAYARLAHSHHPDKPGGDHDKMAALNRAIEDARAELAGG